MPLHLSKDDLIEVDSFPSSLEKPKNELDRLKRSLQVEIAGLIDKDNVQLFINTRPILIKPLTPLE